MAELSLTALGIEGEAASHAVALFQRHDEDNLAATHAIYRDERQLIQTARQSSEELTGLFEADQKQ